MEQKHIKRDLVSNCYIQSVMGGLVRPMGWPKKKVWMGNYDTIVSPNVPNLFGAIINVTLIKNYMPLRG